PGQTGHVLTPAPYSRIRTRYAGLFGRGGAYIMSAGEGFEGASRYVRGMRGLLPRMPRACGAAAAKSWAGAFALNCRLRVQDRCFKEARSAERRSCAAKGFSRTGRPVQRASMPLAP